MQQSSPSLVKAHTGPAGNALAGPCALEAMRDGPPSIMGIVNITPDSFSDGGSLTSVDAALHRAAAHIEAGAHVLDIGGESTQPNAQSVSADEQMRRVLPVIEAIAREGFEAVLSIDTTDARVAQAALARGVTLINDVTGLGDDRMVAVAHKAQAHVIVMHMRGTPLSMQSPTHTIYTDGVVTGVCTELVAAAARAHAGGIETNKVWLDPGFGFAKLAPDNWQLVRDFEALCALGYPVLAGPSRKSFLAAATPAPPEGRDAATAAVCCACVAAGAQMVRVHNVAAVRDAVAVGYALRQAPAA